MSKKKGDKDGVVYSTNPDYQFNNNDESTDSVQPGKQTLYIVLERLKGGKVATVVENFIGPEAELEALGKELKTKCGSGGSVKDGVIIIQGEQRDKVITLLTKMGYKTKKKGG
ncbi:MAG: translation initiation factor [Chitinophagales bacterium]